MFDGTIKLGRPEYYPRYNVEESRERKQPAGHRILQLWVGYHVRKARSSIERKAAAVRRTNSSSYY